MFITGRQLNIYSLILVLIALSVGFYVQYGLGFEPCVLCIIQRVCMSTVGCLLLVAAFHNQNKNWLKGYLVLGLIVVAIGLLAVGRQLYLQSLPQPESEMCLPGATFFWHAGQYFKAITSLFTGNVECGQVSWRFLGLSLAAWSGLFLSGLFVMLCASLVMVKKE